MMSDSNESESNQQSSQQINNTSANSLNQSLQQQQFMFNPLNFGIMSNPIGFIDILNSDQYPDILQHFSAENCRKLFELIKESNNFSLANKKGRQGGYTPLHWMAIKNEVDLAEYLITECKADVNSRGDLGETSILIAIKYILI